MSELSKLDTLLQKTHIKVLLVLRLDMCRSILSFSTIAHQMWRDHLFSQRNRTTERREGVGLGVAGCVYVCVNVCVCACVCGGEGGGQNLKKGRGQGMWGGFHKIGGLAPLWRLCKETWKISHPSHYKPPPLLIPGSPPVSSKNFQFVNQSALVLMKVLYIFPDRCCTRFDRYCFTLYLF